MTQARGEQNGTGVAMTLLLVAAAVASIRGRPDGLKTLLDRP